MAGRTVIVLSRRGDQPKILGLSALHRTLLGFHHAGATRLVLVPDGGEELPPDLQGRVIIAAREEGEGDVALALRLAHGDAVVFVAPAVVVGTKDASAILSAEVPKGGAVRVAGGLVCVVSAEALAKAHACHDMASLLANLPEGLVLDMDPVSVVRRDEGIATRREIEDLLLDGLRKPLEIDGLIGYYAQRPITTRITRYLARTPLRPNHLTLLALLVGVSSGFFVATGDTLMTAIGGALFFLGSFFDCLDGELARLKFMFSRSGEWLDTLADDGSTISFLVGMTANLAARHNSGLITWLGAIAVASFILASLYVYHQVATVYHTGDVAKFQYSFMKESAGVPRTGIMRWAVFVVKRDFFSALFFGCAAIGFLEPAFVFTVMGSLGFALAVVVTAAHNARLRHTSPAVVVAASDGGFQLQRARKT